MIPELKFDDKGLIPAIIQDAESNEVLMMAYMDKTSLEKTLKTGFTHFWSRSRKKYWMKGETSGNVQEVKEILYDCDEDTLLVKSNPARCRCLPHRRENLLFQKHQKNLNLKVAAGCDCLSAILNYFLKVLMLVR